MGSLQQSLVMSLRPKVVQTKYMSYSIKSYIYDFLYIIYIYIHTCVYIHIFVHIYVYIKKDVLVSMFL